MKRLSLMTRWCSGYKRLNKHDSMIGIKYFKEWQIDLDLCSFTSTLNLQKTIFKSTPISSSPFLRKSTESIDVVFNDGVC